MTNGIGITNIKETRLWKRLKLSFGDEKTDEVASFLSSNLLNVCDEAANRMKAFPSLHPQFTLHDEIHLIRITELMAKLIPENIIANVLNPVEISLLILSAYFHDQGMVLEQSELNQLNTDDRFQLFKKNWEIEHPNLRELSQRSMDSRLSSSEKARSRELEGELLAACLTDFIRSTHGERSREYVLSQYKDDKRLNVQGTNISSLAAQLSLSHVLPVSAITPSNGFRYDESIGTFSVNIVYLSLVLRLADLLDFDRERTPDELFRTIHFASVISMEEWGKHRSIEGWIIRCDLIRFTAKCKHPAYQRAILRFMDYIDIELTNIRSALDLFPKSVDKYVLPLPGKVDRNRIEPEHNSYVYHDLEFSLSRDEIIKLLMTDNLYPPHLCIRELLQNSLDAIRHRKAILRRDEGVEWTEGKVYFEHSLDDTGREVLRCSDNGVGMDEAIITRFFARVGRSYYRSPEFEQERATFTSANADFDPCARFGIGFMSCFMIGDNIKIKTRRYYGSKKTSSIPLVVEINGLSGLFVIRRGQEEQPIGTTVEITGRTKPIYMDEWNDKVLLIDVLKGYALACEFPILAKCTIPEISEDIEIPASVSVPVTLLEAAKVSKIHVYEQPFGEIDPQLQGSIRTCLLLDANGNVSLSNDEAEWIQTEQGPEIKIHKNIDLKSRYNDSKSCIDGILVCGEPGRDRSEVPRLGWHANQIHLGRDRFVLDIRGAIKPRLTPARHPPKFSGFELDFSWRYIQRLADRAQGRLWEKILAKVSGIDNAETLLQLLTLHGVQPAKFKAHTIWANLFFPILGCSLSSEWRLLKDVGALCFDRQVEKDRLMLTGNATIEGYEKLTRWKDNNKHIIVNYLLHNVVISMGTLNILNGKPVLEFREPCNSEDIPWERIIRKHFSSWYYCIPYALQLKNALSVEGAVQTVNMNHSLVKLVRDSENVENKNELQNFANAVVCCLSNPDTFKFMSDPNYILNSGDRWRKYIGHLYMALDWKQIDPSLHPPYELWLQDRGLIHFTGEDFKKWAKA
ncbi:MAG: hypothetical protein WAX69_11700 [Victivallales bacterium]